MFDICNQIEKNIMIADMFYFNAYLCIKIYNSMFLMKKLTFFK